MKIAKRIAGGSVLLAACVGLVLHGAQARAQAQAQGQDTTPQVVEEVIVTGTNIRGAEIIGSTTQTISAEEVAASGRATVGDYLREIPANFAGGVGMSDESQSGQDASPAAANLSGGQGVNLRGLGALSTLVLVNGRRMPASGQFGDFVDISTIALAAVERMEILPDGASAVYGSDAVGGVVNFILKRRVDAPATSVTFGAPTEGGGEEMTISHLFGLDWNGGNAVFGAEYYQRDHIKSTDRERYERGSDFSSRGGVNWRRYTAHFSPAANIFIGGYDGAGSVSSPVGASVPNGANTNLSQSDLILHTDGVGNTANVYDQLDLLPEAERVSVFGSLDHQLGDRVKLFGDLRYTERDATYDLGYGVIGATETSYSILTPDSPFYIEDIAANLRDADGNIAFGLVVDDRAETREVSVKSYGAQLGVEFAFGGDWALQVAGSYGRDEQRRRSHQLSNFGLAGALNKVDCALRNFYEGPPQSAIDACLALNLTPLNPFSTEPMSKQQLDQIFGVEDLSFDSYVVQGSTKADGSLFELPAGAVKLATGVDVRREYIDGYLTWDTASIEKRSGPYAPTERDALAGFAEFAVPVLSSLDVSLAARYEEFSGTGDYDTFNPKFGVNWAPLPGLKLRGSWGTSFHAPPMRFENDSPQPLPGGNAAFTLPASYRGPCDSDLVEFNGLRGTPGVAGESCTFTVIINSGGAGPGVLKPEEATTWTLGFDVEPAALPGFRASLSYFDIEVEDRIQRIQSGTLPGIVAEFFATGTSPFIKALNVRPDAAAAQALMDNPKYLGTFGPPLANSAADVQMIVNATQINIASLRESGVDFSVQYDWDMGGHLLGVFAYGTYLRTYETQAAPGLDFIDQLGKYSSFGAPVQLRSKQGMRWAHGALDATLTINYTDSYECTIGSCFVPAADGSPVTNTRPMGIDAWVTADLNVGWDLSGFGGFVQGARVALNVTNLSNEEAPWFDGGTGYSDSVPTAYDPNNATIIGRTVALTLTKRW